MKTLKTLFISISVTAIVAGCKKDDVPQAPVKVTTGLYVLSEGLFNNNNTTLTYYSFSTNSPSTDLAWCSTNLAKYTLREGWQGLREIHQVPGTLIQQIFQDLDEAGVRQQGTTTLAAALAANTRRSRQ